MQEPQPHLNAIVDGLCDSWINRFENQNIDIGIREDGRSSTQRSTNDGNFLIGVTLPKEVNRRVNIMLFQMADRYALAR